MKPRVDLLSVEILVLFDLLRAVGVVFVVKVDADSIESGRNATGTIRAELRPTAHFAAFVRVDPCTRQTGFQACRYVGQIFVRCAAAADFVLRRFIGSVR